MQTFENVANTIQDQVKANNRVEGDLTKKVEQITSAIPSMTFLHLAGASVLASMVLKLMGRHSTAIFVGEWAPTILLLGIYNKLVKVMGSDRQSMQQQQPVL